MVAKGGSEAKTALTQQEQGPYLKALTMEPATRIERATYGLRNSAKATSDNVTPQETTKHDASDTAVDGSALSCPGSSVVADEE